MASPGLIGAVAFRGSEVGTVVPALGTGVAARELPASAGCGVDERAGAGAGSDFLKNFENAPNMCSELR